MLARYTMYRRRPADAGPLPEGIRQDTRWRTKHLLRPSQAIVEAFLAEPNEAAWTRFCKAYRALLQERFASEKQAFRDLAALATTNDVYLGCNCPTQKNPNVSHCHTVLALAFMRDHFPALDVRLPPRDA
ncbi:DUF488 family protein, N3 subclade [Lignipirellula cremea]|uniref:DUF488 domain-containing protein n=1 Tax=Lignipirellula cremea TaxID=2528010 RepID=A0A518DRY3_9BACT|nr:hypothetical protein [Lignipirellula cremea]QDU94574.1 hypothetical protein Pla8534_23660 [Lignipirellula cremea]